MRVQRTRVALVGREGELDELRGELERCRRRAFRCAVLEGEPGIGKTRLANEFLDERGARVLTLHARGYPYGAASTFGLWAEAFESHLRGLPSAEVAEICGDALGDLAVLIRSAAAASDDHHRRPAQPTTPSAVRLRESLAVLLRSLACRQPVVVLLDDLHLADVSSWEALDYMAHNLADARVLVLGCVRPGELDGLPAPQHVLFRLEQEGLLHRIDVGPLSGDHLRSLAEHLVGPKTRALPVTLGSWLEARSGGNPLFAIALLEALIEEDQDLAAPCLDAVPKPLNDRLSARLASLPTEALELLDVLAVVGHRVELGDLRRFSRRSLTALAETLPRLVEAHLVDEREHGSVVDYEIPHPLMQEVIYARLGGARRRALHRRIGRTLLSEDRLGEAATHLARSAEVGDEEAIDALARAAQQAWSRNAFGESFLVAHAMLELVPSGDDRWLDLLDVLSPGREWLFYEHKEDLDTALGVRIMRQMQRILDGSSADPARLAAFNLYLSVFLGWGNGDRGEAVRRGHDAVELFRKAGDDELARLAAHELSWIHGVDGDFAAQEGSAREVMAEAQHAGDTTATVMAMRSLAATLWPRGRFDEARVVSQRSIDLAASRDNPTNVVHGHAFLALMLAFEGRLAAAKDALRRAVDADPAGTEPLVTEVGLLLSVLAGDIDAALSEARRAAAGMGPGQSWVLLVGALAGLEAGETGEARRFLDALTAVMADRRYWMMTLQFRWISGLLTGQEGDRAAAVEDLKAVADDLLYIDAVAVAALVLLDLCEVAAEAERPDVVADATKQLDEIARRTGGEHHAALAACARGWASLAADEHTEASRHAHHAAAQFGVSGHRVHQARALYLAGRATAAVDGRRAAKDLRQAITLFDACSARTRRARASEVLASLGRHGRRTLASVAGPGPLTPRERQVVALAITGLTAREVAERLFIGERTVETHLANIYAKLGVHSRMELLRFAAELQV